MGIFEVLYFKLITWPLGFFLYLASKFILATVKVQMRGNLYSGPAVYVNWHRNIPVLLLHHGPLKRWTMVSKNPGLDKVAVWLHLLGFKIIRGATGENGRKTLELLEKEILTHRESVTLSVDGPKGPAFVVKPGCIILAQNTGFPIIPVSISSKRGFEISSRWDKRYMVTPFDEVEIFYGEPIFVKKGDSIEELQKLVEKRLNELA